MEITDENFYEQELKRIEEQRTTRIKWAVSAFITMICLSAFGPVRTTSIWIVAYLANASIKSILFLRQENVITDKETVVYLVLGFLTLLGCIEAIYPGNLF